jgi:hypothetical protein
MERFVGQGCRHNVLSSPGRLYLIERKGTRVFCHPLCGGMGKGRLDHEQRGW